MTSPLGFRRSLIHHRSFDATKPCLSRQRRLRVHSRFPFDFRSHRYRVTAEHNNRNRCCRLRVVISPCRQLSNTTDKSSKEDDLPRYTGSRFASYACRLAHDACTCSRRWHSAASSAKRYPTMFKYHCIMVRNRTTSWKITNICSQAGQLEYGWFGACSGGSNHVAGALSCG